VGGVKIDVKGRGGVSRAFDCPPDERILHAGLAAGVGLPYECGTGTCGTCRATLVEGNVDAGWPEAPGRKYFKAGRDELLMCQARPLADCALEFGAGFAEAHRCAPGHVAGTIVRQTPLTHDVVDLDVALDRAVDFDAGQYMILTAPGIAGGRSYSMVNDAAATTIFNFVIKRKPGGALSDWLFERRVEGERVELFGPLGHAIFSPEIERNLLVIAGGSGIAGMMSILSRACAAGHFERFTGDVFFGVRTPRDFFYLEALVGFRAKAQASLRVVVALSDAAAPPEAQAAHPALEFDTGFVHEVAGRRMQGRYTNVRAYVAGPPPAVDASLRMLLREARLPATEIRYDKFS
jgi:toluene monooxygenase electron transfer component